MWGLQVLVGLNALGCSTLILGQGDVGQCEESDAIGCEPGSGGVGGGQGGESGESGQGGQADIGSSSFIVGADISWTLEDERSGATYFHEGVPKGLVEILADHGFNYVRLRTFVDPAAQGGYAYGALEAWNDLEHTIEMARRLYQHDMGFLLNFHYSDTWADPGHQQVPLAWQSMSFDALQTRVYEYTRESLASFQAAGVPPHMVQIGNEITSGMLHPHGISYPDENWPKLAALLKAGIAAVRDTDPAIRVMLQIDKCNDNGASRWWIDNAIQNGVEFDILAQSCYTAYQGTPSEWRANFVDLVQRYPQLQFVVGEYSHEKRAANQIMFDLPSARGLGSFIWEPTRWMESIFDPGLDKRYATNSFIDLYPSMVSDFAR